MKANKNRIMICVIAGFVLIVLITCFIIAFSNRTKYYECTEYYVTQKTTGDPVKTEYLELYSYYRIYLDEDAATFKLVYKIESTGVTKTYKGFYSIQNGILLLDYKGSEDSSPYYEESSGFAYYKISGDTLTRIASKTDKTEGQFQATQMRTVYQKFEKKITW